MSMIYTLKDIEELPLGAYGVIGCPIGHSLSPEIHAALAPGQEYCRILIEPAELGEAVKTLAAKLRGFNATIPHKLAIMKYLKEISPEAERYGAVNTVICENGRMSGYNTDGKGFRKALSIAGMKPEGRILILGAGGVARVIAWECALTGASTVICSRRPEQAEALAMDIKKAYKGADVMGTNAAEGRFDLLVNCTPAGMYPDINGIPADIETVKRAGAAFDTVYNPPVTRLVAEARNLGIPAVNGLYMLVAQAAAARTIWTGSIAGDGLLTEITSKLMEKLKKA